MKTILLNILSADTSCNKSATRYLYKTHPDLWTEIVVATSFLPENAVPKQRVWHILNDVWSIPKCPITNSDVKWFENRYLATANRTAKTELQHKRGDFNNCYTDAINEKRRESNLKAVERGRNYRAKESYTPEQLEKTRNTLLNKYGVDNPSYVPEVRKKISDKKIENGATPIHLRSLRRIYYDAVWYWTDISWKTHFDKINPDRLNRSLNSLDHVYSIQQGFRDNIPPYIIGHWTNLRVIPLSENSKKGMKCDKSIDDLFEHFFTNA